MPTLNDYGQRVMRIRRINSFCRGRSFGVACCLVLLLCFAPASEVRAQVDGQEAPVSPEAPEAEAQHPQEELELEPKGKGWLGRSELGLALTSGNSDAETFTLRGRAERRLERSRLHFRLEGTKTRSADDRFRQVVEGVTWPPGSQPPVAPDTFLVDPLVEPDVENYYFETLLERTVSKTRRLRPGTLRWHIGYNWERNIEAGLIGRSVLFAGVGHEWWDREDLHFSTRYSFSYTNRNEVTLDPEKDPDFAGARASWRYMNRWGPRVVYENEVHFNHSFSDSNDYSATMTQSFDVPMSKKLSLVVTLQWLFNNFPALEDIDTIAEVVIRDPDGVPGSGDEFFETVSAGGSQVLIGSTRERKKTLDTAFSTSLRITF
jgi:hypothetical protein